MQEKEKEKYGQYVKKVTPTHPLGMQIGRAFLSGGVICMLGEIITAAIMRMMGMEREMAASWCTLILVMTAVFLTAAHLYGRIVKWAGAGALVPITGFANSVASTAIEFKKEGQVFGVGSKIFTIAGPVLLYGIVTSWLLGVIYWIMNMIGAG